MSAAVDSAQYSSRTPFYSSDSQVRYCTPVLYVLAILPFPLFSVRASNFSYHKQCIKRYNPKVHTSPTDRQTANPNNRNLWRIKKSIKSSFLEMEVLFISLGIMISKFFCLSFQKECAQGKVHNRCFSYGSMVLNCIYGSYEMKISIRGNWYWILYLLRNPTRVNVSFPLLYNIIFGSRFYITSSVRLGISIDG